MTLPLWKTRRGTIAFFGAIAAATLVTAWITATLCMVALESCAVPNESGGGCQYDTQCVGGRICEKGMCVAPPTPTVATPTARPSPVLATSRDLTDCLEKAQPGFQYPRPLKYVKALVHKSSSGSVSRITLTGQTCTEKGKRDAEGKSEECLGVEKLKFKNQIEIDPTLCPPPPSSSSSPEAEFTPTPAPTPVGASNPCVQLCQSDENTCNAKCVQGGLSNGLFGFKIPQFGEAAACNSQCKNDFDHCRANCDQGGGSGEVVAPPSEGGPPPEDTRPPPD